MANVQITELATTKTRATIDADAEYLPAEPVAGTSYKMLITEAVAAGLAQATAAIEISDDASVSGQLQADLIHGYSTGSIASNNVWSTSIAATGIMVMLIPSVASGVSFGLTYHRNSGTGAAVLVQSGSSLATATSILTGTTGASNKVTVSHTGSTLYIENRLAYVINYNVVVFGA